MQQKKTEGKENPTTTRKNISNIEEDSLLLSIHLFHSFNKDSAHYT